MAKYLLLYTTVNNLADFVGCRNRMTSAVPARIATWSRYLGIDFGHPWPKSPRKRAAMFAAAVLVAAPAPARLNSIIKFFLTY
ncbi:MAG: hypothetical protein GY782_07960 [Gammaproteobacteria bacterium]|nr:hypothetical protein [Gammaproteobacteria bacterium]